MHIWRKAKLWGAVILLAGGAAWGAGAQELSGLARLDVAQSGARDGFYTTHVDLFVSQPVPFRVFTLDDPRRLVIDFREVDFRGVDKAAYTRSAAFTDARFGALRPGWSRMILDLAAPVAVREAGMRVNAVDATATIRIVLEETDAAGFAARAGAPNDPDWAFGIAAGVAAQQPAEDGPLVVVIDPGHGGLDPGAEHGGTQEADVMLALGKELAAALARIEGVQPALTRTDDSFVPLSARLTLARGVRADLLISLHADALEGPQASGATVYTLTNAATEAASQRMAERHERGDLLAGIDLSGQGDEVATVLMDLARLESGAAGERFANALVQAMRDTGAVLNARPRRQAELAVLLAADFPSVLLEVGFLSNDADRDRLSTPQGRAPLVAAVTLAVGRWAIEEQALAPLIRQ